MHQPPLCCYAFAPEAAWCPPHGILFVSFWPAEATWVIGSPEPYSCRKVGRLSGFHPAIVWYRMSHGPWLTNARLLYRTPETFQNHSDQAVINCHWLFPPNPRLSGSLSDFNLQKGYQQQHHCISTVYSSFPCRRTGSPSREPNRNKLCLFIIPEFTSSMDTDKRHAGTIHFGTHERSSRTLSIKESSRNVPWLNDSCPGKINTNSPSHRSDKTHNAPTQILVASRKHCTLVAWFPWEINPKILAWDNSMYKNNNTLGHVLV